MPAVIIAVSAAITSGFGFLKSAKDKKAQQEADRAALVQAVLENRAAQEANKPNYTALYVILSLVIVGTLIGTYFLLKPKS